MPVWPDEFKSVILYVNIGLLYALFGVMFLRLIIYFLIRIFGVEFWLFPNYLEDVIFSFIIEFILIFSVDSLNLLNLFTHVKNVKTVLMDLLVVSLE